MTKNLPKMTKNLPTTRVFQMRAFLLDSVIVCKVFVNVCEVIMIVGEVFIIVIKVFSLYAQFLVLEVHQH